MQIAFPVGNLGGFSCAEAEVRFSYKYKNLRTALSNIPQKDATGVNSKVRLYPTSMHWLISLMVIIIILIIMIIIITVIIIVNSLSSSG